MSAAGAISGFVKQAVVAVASCWAGNRRGDGQPSCKLIGESIANNNVVLTRGYDSESRQQLGDESME